MKISRLVPLLVLNGLLASASLAQAQLSIPWFTIHGGGGSCSNGTCSLQCTIGQCDTARMTSYVLTLQGEPDQPNLSALDDDYEDFSMDGRGEFNED